MKFKVGQKVKVLGGKGWCRTAKKDIGKTATIVKVLDEMKAYFIFVSNSLATTLPMGTYKFTWAVCEEEITSVVGEQLLFDFMKGD